MFDSYGRYSALIFTKSFASLHFSTNYFSIIHLSISVAFFRDLLKVSNYFVRIRGNSKIETKAKIGNFVEIKNSKLGSGTKASHLSYIGDAKIGKNVNVGAGVITCNYDGFKKHVTVVGNNSFIGSNSSLIAPVTIGTNSLIGAGSFINKDVPDYTFAKGRAKQIMKPNKRK